MRLLYSTSNGNLGWTEDLIGDDDLPPYAILSHTWQEGHEVTFDDLKGQNAKSKAGYDKIGFCAQQAERDGLKYFWVDTCCIDKSNSAELTEAINSMFRWYQRAQICYVYLCDVSSSVFDRDGSTSLRRKPAIGKSRWFTRGWTLQELIAPARVEFFSKEWDQLGNKQSLSQTLHERTGIAVRALHGSPMTTFTVEERMLWANGRKTKREEDEAYSLLGIFDVHMPLIYGEGRIGAFERLRKLVIERYSINLPTAKGASFNSHSEEHNARCLPNTRTALLHDIAHWAKSKNGKCIFWLSGMAGTGKSTIARTTAQSFAEAGQLGASFFFKKGEGERGNASRFFSTIATDLVAYEPGMLPGIRKALDEDPALSERALKDQFEKLILGPLTEIQQPRSQTVRIIVIDALDECEREEDIRAILRHLARTKDMQSVPLRVLVTSRPELHVRLGFRQMSNGTYQDLVLHEVPKNMIEHDIRYFLMHELGAIRQARLLSPDWPTMSQVQALVELAVPLFIFAATVCRYIGTKGGDPETYLSKVLQYRKSTFSQLDQTYLPVLNQLLTEQEDDDKESWLREFRDLVGSIAILDSPLSIVSLASLLQIQQKQIECRLDALHSVLSIPDNRDAPIRLLHLSFREFLVDPCKKEKSPFWVDERSVHEKLASRCLELMSAPKGLRQDICGFSAPGILRSEMDEETIASTLPPELQYACRYWVDHLERSHYNITDGDATHIFLQKHLLHWLEFMSLVKETSRCVHLLAILRSLVVPSTSACADFLHDANRFVLRFVSIIADAPLQTYSSALVFAPEASIVRKIFTEQVLHKPQMLSGREADWDACRSVLEGHSSSVRATVFSPDGELIASASDDGTVRVWETVTGACRAMLEGHSDYINTVVFSPDGQLVASASDDRTVRVWETVTGTCRSVLEGHSGYVRAVMFSPDGQLVASASDDMTVRMWETMTGTCRSVLKGHSDYIRAVVLSPDGRLVASASDDRTVRLWETGTGICRSVLEGHSSYVRAVMFSPDGQLVASASGDRTVRVWEVATGTCRSVLKGHSDNVMAVVFSPDGELIASASDDKTVRVWEMATNICRGVLEGHFLHVMAVVFSPDGELVASASIDRTVRIWETATGTCRSVLEGHSGYVSTVVFSPDGQLVASASGDGTVRVWERVTGTCHSVQEGHSFHVRAVVFSPDGELVASASIDRTVRVWETTTGTCRSVLEGHSDDVNTVVFSPYGQLIASASSDRTVRVWETATGTCCSVLEARSSYVRAAVFSPDGQLVALVSSDRIVRVWEALKGTCHSVLEGHSDDVMAVVFSPDGEVVASASRDSTVRVWETATGTCRSVLEGHSSYVKAVVFSPDGDLVASASEDRTVRVWETATGTCCCVLEGHLDHVYAVVFSPDGQLIASASGNETVRVWERASGACCSVLKGHSAFVNPLSFSSDGQVLYTDHGEVHLPYSPIITLPIQQEQQPFYTRVMDSWIWLNHRRFLWVPPQNRTNVTAVRKDMVVLGHVSGRINLLKLH